MHLNRVASSGAWSDLLQRADGPLYKSLNLYIMELKMIRMALGEMSHVFVALMARGDKFLNTTDGSLMAFFRREMRDHMYKNGFDEWCEDSENQVQHVFFDVVLNKLPRSGGTRRTQTNMGESYFIRELNSGIIVPVVSYSSSLNQEVPDDDSYRF